VSNEGHSFVLYSVLLRLRNPIIGQKSTSLSHSIPEIGLLLSKILPKTVEYVVLIVLAS